MFSSIRMQSSVRRLSAAALVAAAGFAGAAQAATIGFDGDKQADPYLESNFSFAPARLVNGNCLSGHCLALNDNETTTMTFVTSPGLFTLTGLNFNLLGKGNKNGGGNTLTLTGSNGTSLSYSTSVFEHNEYHALLFTNEFNVSSITFSTGDVRILMISTPTPAPVPLTLQAFCWSADSARLGLCHAAGVPPLSTKQWVHGPKRTAFRSDGAVGRLTFRRPSPAVSFPPAPCRR